MTTYNVGNGYSLRNLLIYQMAILPLEFLHSLLVHDGRDSYIQPIWQHNIFLWPVSVGSQSSRGTHLSDAVLIERERSCRSLPVSDILYSSPATFFGSFPYERLLRE
jgi:hypothetical protein